MIWPANTGLFCFLEQKIIPSRGQYFLLLETIQSTAEYQSVNADWAMNK